MACPPSNVKFQLRRATSFNWTSTNPILKAGEPGFEIDTQKLKIGDGTTTWINLPYIVESQGIQGSVQYSDGQGNFKGDTGLVYTTGTTGNLKITGDLIPSSDNQYNLGSITNRWSEINIGHGTINIAGPLGSSAVGLIGTDSNSIVYTSTGFATPFINIGPQQGITLNEGNIGGWVIGPTGIAFTSNYDLIAQEKLTTVSYPAGLTGPTYSILKYISPITITDSLQSVGTSGQVLSSTGAGLEWTTVIGPTGPVTSYIFDGGNAQSNYSVGPAFDCGSAN